MSNKATNNNSSKEPIKCEWCSYYHLNTHYYFSLTGHKICINCLEDWCRLSSFGLYKFFENNLPQIKKHPPLAHELVKRFNLVWERQHIMPLGNEHRGLTGAHFNNWLQFTLKESDLLFEVSIFKLPVNLKDSKKPFLVILENLTQPYTAFTFDSEELLNSEYLADELVYRVMPDDYGEYLSKIYEKLWSDYAVPTLTKYLFLEFSHNFERRKSL